MAGRQGLAAGAIVGLILAGAVLPVGRADAVRIGGTFALVDQHGETRSDADFRGRHLLIYFGFTNCPDSCPTALATMANALDELAQRDAGAARRIVPMFISVDPVRDTPEVLRSYALHFTPRLVALTGTPRAVADVARSYGVFAAVVPTGEPGGYVMDHTSFIYLMGPTGDYVRHFESDVGVDGLVDALADVGRPPAPPAGSAR